MELNDGKYEIQGLSVLELGRQYGTPLYVYDADQIILQIDRLRKAFEQTDLKIQYAAKALTNISILKLIKEQHCGIDVVSINEAHLALRAGFRSTDIMFTPSGVDFPELVEAIHLGLHINLDSLSLMEKFGEAYGNSYPCCIRLNPNILAGGNYKISTGHAHSKFGISIQQLQEIKETISKWGLDVIGLHIHTGSEITDVDVFLKMADILFDIAAQFPSLKFLNFGGGFKVAYKAGDKVTDIDALGMQLAKAFDEFKKVHGRHLQLWIEPGKFIVSEAGILLVTTNVVKPTPLVTFVGVNSGLNHLIRPMMYDAYHEIVNISNPNGELKLYTVVGNICETDTFGADRSLNEVREGDMLCLKNAGAYAYSMASTYNSRLRPPEVLIYKGKAQLVRRKDTLDDLIAGQIEMNFD